MQLSLPRFLEEKVRQTKTQNMREREREREEREREREGGRERDRKKRKKERKTQREREREREREKRTYTIYYMHARTLVRTFALTYSTQRCDPVPYPPLYSTAIGRHRRH